jgi:hypothetical protein
MDLISGGDYSQVIRLSELAAPVASGTLHCKIEQSTTPNPDGWRTKPALNLIVIIFLKEKQQKCSVVF